jgi:hypothetical protein
MSAGSIFRRVLPAIAVSLVFASAFVSTEHRWYSSPNYQPIALALVSGWRPSAERLSKAWHADWLDLALWLAAGFIALLLMHSMFRWLSTGRTSWRMRSTSAVFGLLGANLLFAMSAVGIAHQTGWWLESAEPKWRSSFELYESPLHDAFEAEEITEALAKNRENIPAAELRSAILQKLAPMHERMFISVFNDEQGIATGVLIAPRDPADRARIGYILVSGRNERNPDPLQQPIDNAAIDSLLFGELKPGDQRIKAGDLPKLSSELQRLGVDPTPFMERWRFDLAQAQR